MQRINEQLTAALLTPPGRGAVAVIRLRSARPENAEVLTSCVGQFFQAINGRSLAELEVGRLCYGYWSATSTPSTTLESSVLDSVREDVVVCRTASDELEVSCHGGPAAVQRILSNLNSLGIETVDWQSQPVITGSPLDVEFASALSQTRTAKTAAFVLSQASGVFRESVEKLCDEPNPGSLNRLLNWSDFGTHLVKPWRVVLAGRPNVGKSTLINALLGYTRAIVFDQPGTTRDVVSGETAFDGWPVQLSDTAGIRTTNDCLEQEGITRTRQALSQADLVCLLIDLSQPEDEEETELLQELASGGGQLVPCLVIAHKSDQSAIRELSDSFEAIPVSSIRGEGVGELISRIIETLVPIEPSPGKPLPVTDRQTAWLKQASNALTHGRVGECSSALKHCLDGSPFDGSSAR